MKYKSFCEVEIIPAIWETSISNETQKSEISKTVGVNLLNPQPFYASRHCDPDPETSGGEAIWGKPKARRFVYNFEKF